MADIHAPILRIRGLHVQTQPGKDPQHPDGNSLLAGVDLELAPGEVLGLIGESGAGKSTLGLAALGYFRAGCRPTAGEVIFAGVDLLQLREKELRALRGAKLAYVSQSPAASFNPFKRVGRQIAESLVLHRECSWAEGLEQAISLLDELEIPDPQAFALRYPHQVSGGQLQRAMIAMAMACGPDLLVLDEPTTALDVTTQVGVLAAIRKTLRRHRTAALYISHDLAVVAQLADRILVLRSGRCVEVADTPELIERPIAGYTRELLNAFSMGAASRQETGEGDSALPQEWHESPSATSHAPMLTLDGVTVGYANAPSVVKNVTLRVDRGRTLAIVGTSGSGKSTLARAICGLMASEAGSLSFDGQPLVPDYRHRTADQSRRIQLVYQHPDTALNPGQTIGDMLSRVVERHFGGTKASLRKRVAELLEMVSLPSDIAARKPSKLSGGQKQRVGIARALAAKPDLMICDEVTSALDPLIALEILELLARLQRETGVAYLFITHDLGIVRRIADSVAVMRDGRVVSNGTVHEVFDASPDDYTKFLLSSVPQLHQGWLDERLAQREPPVHGLHRIADVHPGSSLAQPIVPQHQYST